MKPQFANVTQLDILENEAFYNLEYPFIKFCQNQTHRVNSWVNAAGSSISRHRDYGNDVPPLINIIIPVYGRKNHLKQSAQCLVDQVKVLEDPSRVMVTVVEMSPEAEHKDYCEKLSIDYLHMKSSVFNKSAAMNTAASSFPAETFVFFDVDLVTGKDWVLQCLNTVRELHSGGDSCFVLQPIPERKIYYVDEIKTKEIFDGKSNIASLAHGDHYVQPEWYKGNFPPGGAVLVSANLLYAVQGYDPPFFWSYSPEDLMFSKRATRFSTKKSFLAWNKNESMDIEVYHLHHENKENTNPCYEHMTFMSDILDYNQSLGDWYSQDKVRWNGISNQNFRLLQSAEQRFVADISQDVQDTLYHNPDMTEEQLTNETIHKPYPELPRYNPALYEVFVQYIRYMIKRKDHFFKVFRSS